MSRAQSNPRNRSAEERGSVLIFVVGVLLLLAIIATAFLGTSRTDRTSTQQNAYNTQIDLLLEGVINGVKGSLLADARTQTGSNNYDSLIEDKFLAARLPTLLNSATAINNAGVGTTAYNPPVWPAITGPLLDASFSSPFDPTLLYGNPPAATFVRHNLDPTTFTYNGKTYPGFFVALEQLTGAFPVTPMTATRVIIPGVDTDEDGIADACYVKLPVGTIAGVTYYCAVRVVDLGSALNVNTAWASNDPAAAAAVPANPYRLEANYFPTNIDLIGILTGSAAQATTQMDGLNRYRSGSTGAGYAFSTTPIDDNQYSRIDFLFGGTAATSADALWSQLGRRIENPGYNSIGGTVLKYKAYDQAVAAALASKFILRPTVPTAPIETTLTYAIGNSGPATDTPYNAATVYSNTVAGHPKDRFLWYVENFNFGAANASPQIMPLRSLLTSYNPVGSDDAKSVDAPALVNAWATAIDYTFGDLISVSITTGGVQSEKRTFVCIKPHTSAAANDPKTPAGLEFWALVSSRDVMSKVPVNTADFGELLWGFRRLMAADVTKELARAPFPVPNTNTTPYLPPYYPLTTNYAAGDRARQFRSPVRYPGTTTTFPYPVAAGTEHLTPSEVLQLRSAIAAVNAMDLRDNDSNVTAKRITTFDYTTTPPTALHDITVFGTEMQPYITEVYFNNDQSAAVPPANPFGYVAIELYNPYPVAMNLGGWSLGFINRSATGTYPRTITPVLPASSVDYPDQCFPLTANVIVPPYGRLILENWADAANGDVPNPLVDAGHRPPEVVFATAQSVKTISATAPALPDSVYYKFVTGLAQGVAGYNATGPGGEIVLMRPRVWNPTTGSTHTVSLPTTTAGVVEDRNYELYGTSPNAIPNLADWVPIDSFDFSGMTYEPVGTTTFRAWRYARAGEASATAVTATSPAPARKAWHWTHGGSYANGAAGTLQQGIVSDPTPQGTPPTGVAFTPTMLGQAKDLPTFIDPHLIGTQVNNVDWPSPNYAAGGGPNHTPFGTFAQETDLFKVPYIGAYTIRSILTAGYAAPGQLPTDTPAASFTEMNALPMDFSFADDEDAANDGIEPVGRFCPLSTFDPFNYRFWPDPAVWGGMPPVPTDWYDFSRFSGSPISRTLTDVFTVRSPLDDTLPAVGAEEYALAVGANPNYTPMAVQNANPTKAPGVMYAVVNAVSGNAITLTGNFVNQPAMYGGLLLQGLSGASRGEMTRIVPGTATFTGATPAQLVVTVDAAGGLATGMAVRILGVPEDTIGTQGLININTAPWQVLARLPLVYDPATGLVDRVASEAVARRIVTFRDGDPSNTSGTTDNLRKPHGPFKSILDLNKVLSVPAAGTGTSSSEAAYFQTAASPMTTPLDMTLDYPGFQYGDLTPLDTTALNRPDNVLGDFENRYLTLSRISNLITTRSDAFAVYIVLQGWRDVGTKDAKMVTQRRAAYIMDRSGTTTSAPKIEATRVPTN